MKNIDKSIIYNSANDFFSLNGSVIMKLSVNAAKEVCEVAVNHNKYVIRIEGGIWHNPGFEARLDCIWDGLDIVNNINEAIKNNKEAENFIKEESRDHDVFIITTKDM